MVQDPRRNGHHNKEAGSLLFFVVAVLVLITAAGLELLHRLPPLQVESHALLFLLLAVLAVGVFRLYTKLR